MIPFLHVAVLVEVDVLAVSETWMILSVYVHMIFLVS